MTGIMWAGLGRCNGTAPAAIEGLSKKDRCDIQLAAFKLAKKVPGIIGPVVATETGSIPPND